MSGVIDLDVFDSYTTRRLLAAVSRWARENGWERLYAIRARQCVERDLAVSWEAGLVYVDRVADGHIYSSHVAVASVREALDVLAALGVIPASFSTQYAAGRASRVIDDWLAEVTAA
jgi:hypothetical protein